LSSAALNPLRECVASAALRQHPPSRGGGQMPVRDADARRAGAGRTRGPLMEAEALTTHTWSMQSVPEDERAMPDRAETLAAETAAETEADTEAETEAAQTAAIEEVAVATLIAEPLTSDPAAPDAAGIEKTFRDLGGAEPYAAALEDAGSTRAFPIQALALPIALDG